MRRKMNEIALTQQQQRQKQKQQQQKRRPQTGANDTQKHLPLKMLRFIYIYYQDVKQRANKK